MLPVFCGADFQQSLGSRRGIQHVRYIHKPQLQARSYLHTRAPSLLLHTYLSASLPTHAINCNPLAATNNPLLTANMTMPDLTPTFLNVKLPYMFVNQMTTMNAVSE
jgi:hypothetical protein